jgi:hypothetical protein
MKKSLNILCLCLFFCAFLFFNAYQKYNNTLIEDNLGDGLEEVVISRIDNITRGSAIIQINNSFSTVNEVGFVWSDIKKKEPYLLICSLVLKESKKNYRGCVVFRSRNNL